MAVGSNAVAERYNALSVTLEMPFRDVERPPRPIPVRGWSRKRPLRPALSRVLDAAPTISCARWFDFLAFLR